MNGTTESALKEYTYLLIRLQKIIVDEQDDTEEAEILRDNMDPVWYRLSPDEMELAGMISADLDMLRDDEVYRPAVDNLTPAMFESRFNGAQSREDWIDVLRLLRSGPPFLVEHPAEMAYLRGRSYDELEFPELAWRFFDYAAQLAPNNPRYPSLSLDALVRAGHDEEAVSRAEDILADESFHIVLRVKAAAVLYQFSLQQSEEVAKPLREQIVTALKSALSPIDAQGTADIMPTFAAGYILLGLCYGDLGRMEDARIACSESLCLNPGNTAAKELVDAIQEMINSQVANPPVLSSEVTMSPPAHWLEWDSIRRRSLNNIGGITADAGSHVSAAVLAAA